MKQAAYVQSIRSNNDVNKMNHMQRVSAPTKPLEKILLQPKYIGVFICVNQSQGVSPTSDPLLLK